jgi:hypothetical protein
MAQFDSDDDEMILRLKAFESEDEIHLLPEEDTLEHEPTKDCICIPQRNEDIEGLEAEMDAGKKIYLHFDASLREYH